jgi:hypothetical protein
VLLHGVIVRLWLASLLLIPLSIGALIYYQCTQNRSNEANIKQDQANETPATPAVHQPNTQTEQANAYDASKDCLYRLYLFATIAGVCVALGGIYAIYQQTEATKQASIATTDAARETARSAKATEDSVRLQESALRQWVNIEQWQVWMDKKTSTLRIRFQIVNPTTLPLDLGVIDMITEVLDIDSKPFPEHSQVSEVLPPSNPFIADICVPLSPEETEKLLDFPDDAAVNVFVTCVIEFTDSASRHWKQIFERAVIFDKGKFFALKGYDHVTPLVRQLRNHLEEQRAH